MTTVRESAFAGAALTSVVIPASVSFIESGAFSGCAALTEIHFGHSADDSLTIQSAAFAVYGEEMLSTTVFVQDADVYSMHLNIRDYDWFNDGREVTFRSNEREPAVIDSASVIFNGLIQIKYYFVLPDSLKNAEDCSLVFYKDG